RGAMARGGDQTICAIDSVLPLSHRDRPSVRVRGFCRWQRRRRAAGGVGERRVRLRKLFLEGGAGAVVYPDIVLVELPDQGQRLRINGVGARSAAGDVQRSVADILPTEAVGEYAQRVIEALGDPD